MKRQRAQTMVLVALMLTVLLGFLALALDGGNAYLQRRRMQNAADAGALAGAKALCEGSGWAIAANTAQDYCVNRNGAESCTVTQPAEKVVQVVASINTPTWFARVLGINNIPVSAQAQASCSPPAGSGNLLPLAVMLPGNATFIPCDAASTCDPKCPYYQLWNKESADTKKLCSSTPAPPTPYPQCSNDSGAFGFIDWQPRSAVCPCGNGSQGLGCEILHPECAPPIVAGNWYTFPEPGAELNPVIDELMTYCCQHVTVPIVDQMTYQGNNTTYHVVGFGEFVLTGICKGNKAYGCPGLPPPDCGNQDQMVRAYFVKWLTGPPASTSGGNDYGVYVVHLLR